MQSVIFRIFVVALLAFVWQTNAYAASIHFQGKDFPLAITDQDHRPWQTAKVLPARLQEVAIGKRCLTISGSAYSADAGQTDSTPTIAAWGYRYTAKDYDRAIAISKDLLNLGLTDGSRVTIDGGTYVVRDKMHPRWRKKVDFLKANRKAAMRFGYRKNLTLCY